jgi:hypothetical protein
MYEVDVQIKDVLTRNFVYSNANTVRELNTVPTCT